MRRSNGLPRRRAAHARPRPRGRARLRGLALLGAFAVLAGAVAATTLRTPPPEPAPRALAAMGLLPQESVPAPVSGPAPTPTPTQPKPDPQAANPRAAEPQTAEPAPAAPPPAPAPPPPPPVPQGAPVYLTFDDGPDPGITPQILDLLAAHGAKATFFVQGSQVAANPALAQRAAAEGHSVQNHTWDHARLTSLSWAGTVHDQLLPTNSAILTSTGRAPSCLRAPYGATSPAVRSAAAEAGLEVVGWSLNPRDYESPGAATIVNRVLASVGPGSIVLLHDAGDGDRQQTVEALGSLLPAFAERGLRAAALCL